MLFEIKDIFGNIIHTQEAATFKEAVENAIRNRVSLTRADLVEVDLSGADLRGADFSCVDACRANFRGADLDGANMQFADLDRADFRGASLIDTDFQRSYFEGANFNTRLEFVKFDNRIPDYLRVVPEKGEFYGFKKCQGGVLVELLILADAERSNAFSRKCRASKAIVLDVVGAKVGVSMRDRKITYRVGEIVYPDKWDSKWWNECSNGIHFFMTRQEASVYTLY